MMEMVILMNHSSDDGARLLWLEFRGPGGEEELDMGKNPKVGDVKISRTVFFYLLTIDRSVG